MQDYFALMKTSNIILYGAAAIGTMTQDILLKNGYHVMGFIDKRANELNSFCNLPVWSISEVNEQKELFKDAIIFISVKNVFEHEFIAAEFVDNGFTKIIYRPNNVLSGCGNDDEKELNRVYDEIVNGTFNNLEHIPLIHNIETYELKDCATISNLDNNQRIAFIPMEYVYTDNYTDKSIIWGDINIMALIPHLDLFRFIAGETDADYYEYINFCSEAAERTGKIKVTQAWKENVLKNRTDVYEHMNLSFELEHDFFVRNAPIAIWNEKGYFNLKSGKHRAAFLASKRLKYMPLKICNDDYNNWINIGKILNVSDIIKEQKIRRLSAPINHSYFYNFPCISVDYYVNYMYKITEFISKYLHCNYKNLDFSQVKILSFTNDLGMLERHLSKMGCQVYYVLEKKTDMELCDRIGELLHSNNIQYIHNVDININYNLILFDDNEIDSLDEILEYVSEYLFVTHKYDSHSNIKIENKGYIRYKTLSNSVQNGIAKYITIYKNKVVD